MNGDKTINEASPVEVNDEAVDPEDQETVMFGQRHLFQDVDLVATKRQAEAKTGSQRARYRRSRAPREAPDTVVTAPPVEAETDPALQKGNGSKKRRARLADEHVWDDEAQVESPDTVEMDAEEAAHEVAQATRGRRGEVKRRDAKTKAETRTAKREQPRADRQVAERRPAEARQGRSRRRTADMSCNCRMCGKSVNWPKARRFRGRKKSVHGFRCDTCGNVFCAEHVVRASSFSESLLHHGRFRCLLCELSQMAKQAEQMRARNIRSD